MKLTKEYVQRLLENRYRCGIDSPGVGELCRFWQTNQWQPIATAPKTGKVDLWTEVEGHEGWRVPSAWWTDEHGWIWGECDTLYKVVGTPTHWRPEAEGPGITGNEVSKDNAIADKMKACD